MVFLSNPYFSSFWHPFLPAPPPEWECSLPPQILRPSTWWGKNISIFLDALASLESDINILKYYGHWHKFVTFFFVRYRINVLTMLADITILQPYNLTTFNLTTLQPYNHPWAILFFWIIAIFSRYFNMMQYIAILSRYFSSGKLVKKVGNFL